MQLTSSAVKERTLPVLAIWRKLRYPLSAAAVGLFTAGVSVGTMVLPATLGWLAVFGAAPNGLALWLGSIGGALMFGNADALIFVLAGGVLVLSANLLFSRQCAAVPRFPAILSASCTLLLGAVLWFGDGAEPGGLLQLALRIVAAGLTAIAVEARQKDRSSPWELFLLAQLICGGAGLRVFGLVSLGAAAAAALLFLRLREKNAHALAFCIGWGLDLACGRTGCASALTLAVYAARFFPKRWHFRRGAMFFLGFCLPLAAFSGDGALMLSLAIGTLAGVLLPPKKSPPAAKPRPLAAANALMMTASALAVPQIAPSGINCAEVFDRTAAAVCAKCVRYEKCWTEGAEQTYRLFSAVGDRLSRNGQLRTQDFPPAFIDSCCRFSELRSAIIRITDTLTLAQRQRKYREELSDAVAVQCRIFADFLRMPHGGTADPHFVPDYAVCSIGRTDGNCGDRVSAFEAEGRQYLLLCDGMGTGTDAAAEAAFAHRFLVGLLRAGMAAESALYLLNSTVLLRDFGGCVTVDLVCADLKSGEVLLYKWGAAPSYLKFRDKLIKVGTVGLPPGLGVDRTHKPQQIRLSLQRGEVLILTSDGIGGEVAERMLRRCPQGSLQELANGLASCGSAQGEDDATAAVLCLRSQKPHG